MAQPRGVPVCITRVVALGLALFAGAALGPVRAQESWNPFAERGDTERRSAPPVSPQGIERNSRVEQSDLPPLPGPAPDVEPGRQASPADRPQATDVEAWGPPGDGRAAHSIGGNRVDSSDLAPLVAPAGAGRAAGDRAPVAAARRDRGGGLDAQAMARLLVDLEVPYRSPALTALLLRLVSGPDAALAGDGPEQAGVKTVALYRAGRIAEANELLPGRSSDAGGLALWAMRIALARGERADACRFAERLIGGKGDAAGPPKGPRAEALAVRGYCAAAGGNVAAAGLIAEVLRETRAFPPETLAALEAIALGEPVRLGAAKSIEPIDWRLAEIGTGVDTGGFKAETATPAALFAIAGSSTGDPSVRLIVAEAAARLNVIDEAALAEVYRQQSFSAREMEQALSAQLDPVRRRALLFKAAEAERTPLKKTRLVRAALDEARRSGLYLQTAAALAQAVAGIRPAQEIGWFAETAVECTLAARRFGAARDWVRSAERLGVAGERAGGGLDHWLALIDIADPGVRPDQRGAGLNALEDVALRGRLGPEALHRLASVLDALDYQVPFRLWEAASRAPQPTTGHLPPTGVLAELRDASQRRDGAATILAAIRTLGSNGGEGAHMIALGDAVRFLRRAGFDGEARMVALEAMFPIWPRAGSS
jgi:hypothetical protein